MSVEYKTSQLKGPFNAGEELLDKIIEHAATYGFIKHLGIQTMPGTTVFINGNEILIGDAGLYELGENVKINSIKFKENRDERTLIEYMYEYK